MKIRICKWDKYNPRPRGDVKSSSWFRLENEWITDPDFYDYDCGQKLIWIWLCSEASKKMRGEVKINPRQIADALHLAVELVADTIRTFETAGFVEILDPAADSQRTRSELAADPPRTSGEYVADSPEKCALRNGTERNGTGIPPLPPAPGAGGGEECDWGLSRPERELADARGAEAADALLARRGATTPEEYSAWLTQIDGCELARDLLGARWFGSVDSFAAEYGKRVKSHQDLTFEASVRDSAKALARRKVAQARAGPMPAMRAESIRTQPAEAMQN